MKALTPGYLYELSSFEGGPPQQLQFIEKVQSSVKGEETKLITVEDGTTNEEVLEVLLDRMNHLNAKFPCRENSTAITNIEQALLWLNRRTQNRQNRGVEGEHRA